MASSSDLNPDDCRVDINELLPTDESQDIFEHSHQDQGVCVGKVPRSLKAAKPEAFIPHFVGLSPYHYDRPDLILTEKLKLDAASRMLQLPGDVLQHLFDEFIPHTDIRGYYHVDVSDKHPDRNQLLLMLKFDALFLLGLLVLNHRFVTGSVSDNPQEHTHTYFLTGKHGIMPLLNYAGEELTMDAIIRDVFMLENQIPAHFLNQIAHVFLSKSQEIYPGEVYDQDLGSTMKLFCEKLCPFDEPEKPSKRIEAHHHLLDLMYHLTVPESEPKPPSHSLEYPSGCCGIPVVILVAVCFVLGLIVQLIILIVKLILKLISRMVGQIVNLLLLIRLMVVASCNCEIPRTIQLNSVPDQTKKTLITALLGDPLTKWDDKDAPRFVTIQSVTELHSAGIKFLPTQGGISTIQFDDLKSQFHLPTIKVDVNSEVIFRNLVAYETLTKSKCLIFTRYIELMRAIIDTPEDVKLLVQEGIIRTDLTDEVVEQLFNGMSKSIRPTKTPVLDGVIHDVKAKFESTQGLNRIVNYVYSSWKIITAIAALIFLVLQAVQAYCSIFSCSRNRA